MLHGNPILAHLRITPLCRGLRASKARSVRRVARYRRHVLRARCGAVRGRAQMEEITVGVRGTVGDAVVVVIIETDTGPDRRQGEKDNHESEDVRGEFGDIDEVLKDGE